MRSFIYSLGAVLVLLAAIAMQYFTLAYGSVVEGLIRDAFGWISLGLAFIAGVVITAIASGDKP